MLLHISLVIMLLLAVWVYKDAKSRDMNTVD